MNPTRRTFRWQATADEVRDLLARGPVEIDTTGGLCLAHPDGARTTLRLPPVLRVSAGTAPADIVHRLPAELGVEVVLLVRAGRAALGLWIDDELAAHKVFRRYTVRGQGHAQTTHLKTKGKSRYGSRLRLQQAARLLDEVNERLKDWDRDHGPLDVIHRACPVRLWPELCGHDPSPPFDARDPRIAPIRIHTHEPDFEELLRVRRHLTSGVVEESVG
jgi:hypothetical protein